MSRSLLVRNLYLVAIYDFLLEDTISVSKAVSPSRVIERGHTVEETSRKSSKTAITESSIMLLINDILNSESKIGETLWRTSNQ